MVAGIVSAGIGALGNIAGGLASNALSSQQMKDMAQYSAKLNYKYWKKQMLNQPTFYRTGLENANYNPMLALGGMQSGNSNWSQMANPTTPDLSNVGSSAVSNALSVRQQKNNDDMTEAQVQNFNADTVLKTSQSLTQQYEQLEKLAHTDLMKADKVLRDKQATYQDKQNAWYDKRVNEEILHSQTDRKVMLENALSNRIQAYSSGTSARASLINANANAKDVESKVEQRLHQNELTDWESIIKGIKANDMKNPFGRFRLPFGTGYSSSF